MVLKLGPEERGLLWDGTKGREYNFGRKNSKCKDIERNYVSQKPHTILITPLLV